MIIGNEIFIIDKLDAYLERKIYGGCEKNAHELNEKMLLYIVYLQCDEYIIWRKYPPLKLYNSNTSRW